MLESELVIIHNFILQILQNQNEVIFITRPMDKKKVLFYNDRTANLPIDEEFQKLWRSVAVDAMDDAKIEEYLDKQGKFNQIIVIHNEILQST